MQKYLFFTVLFSENNVVMASFEKGLEADLPLYSEPKWCMDVAQIP